MLTPTALKEMICSIVDVSYKATSSSYGMSSLVAAGFLLRLVVILLVSFTVAANRNGLISLLSIARDSSLVPPYDVQSDLNVDIECRNEENLPGADTVHFCFLVHGFQGLSSDLSYFETILKHRACVERNHQSLRQRKRIRQDKYNADDDFVITPTDTDESDGQDFAPSTTQDMVVHNSVCNEGKTTDGLINGGDRLIDEIRGIIDSKMKQRYPELEHVIDDKEISMTEEEEYTNPRCESCSAVNKNEDESDPCRNIRGKDQKKTSVKKLYDITISIIGNSMGGLYGRYAISRLIKRHCVLETTPRQADGGREQKISSSSWILDGKYRLRLDIFCTTAAPHLGVSQHTWIRLPRIAEIGIAATMGETGKDLFRLNNLLYTMCTDSTFLNPLASFRKRIAYANCYGTDFPVPVGTAAFLSHKSTYPHHFWNNSRVEDECGLVAATLMTYANAEESNNTVVDAFDELHQMSVALDRLGWRKVFVDLQSEMLSISLPRLGFSGYNIRGNGQCTDITDLCGLKKHKIVTSKDIADVVNESHKNNANGKRLILSVPVGHNMIVAFSRSRLSAFFNKGGRPLVDALAKDLVQDVFCSNKNDLSSTSSSRRLR